MYKPGRPKAQYRFGAGKLIVGDTFHVKPDLSELDENDPEDQKVLEKYRILVSLLGEKEHFADIETACCITARRRSTTARTMAGSFT